MLYNKNIILGILQSEFADEIETYIDSCVMNFDEYELEDIFECEVEFALLDFIEEITVFDFQVEDGGGAKNIDGVFEVTIDLFGYERVNGETVCRESGVTVLGIGFRFCEEDGEYSDIEFEYLY